MLLASAVVLIMTGSFHGDEMPARDGERWLGLFRTQAGWAWQYARIRVEPENDAVVDAPGEHTGRLVSVGGTALFLLRGMDRLARVRVKAALAPEGGVPLDEQQPVAAGGSVLRREQGRLVLRRDGWEQVVYSCGGECDDVQWTLHWAGDLDGDGRLDYLVGASSHYNVSEMRLLLSSEARGGELVRQVAVFATTGC